MIIPLARPYPPSPPPTLLLVLFQALADCCRRAQPLLHPCCFLLLFGSLIMMHSTSQMGKLVLQAEQIGGPRPGCLCLHVSSPHHTASLRIADRQAGAGGGVHWRPQHGAPRVHDPHLYRPGAPGCSLQPACRALRAALCRPAQALGARVTGPASGLQSVRQRSRGGMGQHGEHLSACFAAPGGWCSGLCYPSPDTPIYLAHGANALPQKEQNTLPRPPGLQVAWKPKPVSLNIPAATRPVRIQLEGTPLLKGMLVLTGCRWGGDGGCEWVLKLKGWGGGQRWRREGWDRDVHTWRRMNGRQGFAHWQVSCCIGASPEARVSALFFCFCLRLNSLLTACSCAWATQSVPASVLQPAHSSQLRLGNPGWEGRHPQAMVKIICNPPGSEEMLRSSACKGKK